jgi:mRNA-degrading endonuclease RelE of RelBE toxin-antitoxin system
VIRFDDLWSKTAGEQLDELPAAVRDQVEALVRQICADPMSHPEAAGIRRTRVARDGRATVLFQVDELERLVYVRGVDWRA